MINVLAVTADARYVSAQDTTWTDAVNRAKAIVDRNSTTLTPVIRVFISWRDESLALRHEEFTPEQLQRVDA